MSSYIWRIPIPLHYVTKYRFSVLSSSTHLVYSSLLLPYAASIRRWPSPSPASHVAYCQTCQVAFCTVIVAVLSCVISGYVLIFGRKKIKIRVG